MGLEVSDKPVFDNREAAGEGWSIFDNGGGEAGPWTLSRIDTMDDPDLPDALFDSDEAAWAFVRERADGGSAYHLGALRFLEEHNPIEYAAIMDDQVALQAARSAFEPGM